MTTNITTAFVRDETLNSNLANLDDDTLAKYIKRAVTVIGSYINLDQFTENNVCTFPEDLQQAVVYFIEWIFVDSGGMFGGGSSEIESESIGNYSYKKSKGTMSSSSDGLYIPQNILSIIESYAQMGMSYGMSVGNLDRKYL